MRATAAIILGAGKSTRMQSDLPKVLHKLCGKPMLAYVLGACREAGIETLNVVVGHQKQSVIDAFAGPSPSGVTTMIIVSATAVSSLAAL